MRLANEIIRDAAKNNNVYLWELADRLGIADTTLSRKLRKELHREEAERAIQIINEIAAERR